MEKYKINGKSITMPTGWHDVIYSDAMNIIENNLDSVQIFSLFSGISEKNIRNLKGEEEIYYFLQGFPFLNKMPVDDTPSVPRSINYKGSRHFFPHVILNDPYDFGDSSVGQIEDMKAIIQKMNKEFIGEEERELTYIEVMKIYPPIVAIYIQPIIEKEYDYKRAMKLADEIKGHLSFKEIVYMGNFFLLKLGGLTNGSRKALRPLNWMKKKSRQVFRKLINCLDSMPH